VPIRITLSAGRVIEVALAEIGANPRSATDVIPANDERAHLQPGSQKSVFDANRYRSLTSACRPYNRTSAFSVTYCRS
jgi:hypothetical protein